MGTSLLYRLFKIGQIPKRMRAAIASEGIVLSDEGVNGSLTFRRFRAPGRRYWYRRTWFCGSVVLTRQRFLGSTFAKPVINLPLNDPRLAGLICSAEGEGTLKVVFAANDFQPDWSGTISCRFHTDRAGRFLQRLYRAGAGRPDPG